MPVHPYDPKLEQLAYTLAQRFYRANRSLGLNFHEVKLAAFDGLGAAQKEFTNDNGGRGFSSLASKRIRSELETLRSTRIKQFQSAF